MNTETKIPITVPLPDMAEAIGTDAKTLMRLILTGQLKACGVMETKAGDVPYFTKRRQAELSNMMTMRKRREQ